MNYNVILLINIWTDQGQLFEWSMTIYPLSQSRPDRYGIYGLLDCSKGLCGWECSMIDRRQYMRLPTVTAATMDLVSDMVG